MDLCRTIGDVVVNYPHPNITGKSHTLQLPRWFECHLLKQFILFPSLESLRPLFLHRCKFVLKIHSTSSLYQKAKHPEIAIACCVCCRGITSIYLIPKVLLHTRLCSWARKPTVYIDSMVEEEFHNTYIPLQPRHACIRRTSRVRGHL